MKAFLVPVFATILSASLCLNASADNWNQFRGPSGDGKSLAKNLPVEFGETKNVRWKTAIPGTGFSSPVVWDNQVWVTTSPDDANELYAIAVDLDSGEIVHNVKVFDFVPDRMNPYDENSDASPTPVVEEGRLYVHFGTNGTACIDTKTGEKLWENREHHCAHDTRPASSPIIEGDSLFVALDGTDVQFIVALDKNTGKTLWRQDRNIDFAEENATYNKAFSTAKVIEFEGRRQLISPAADYTISYDPETGEELWRAFHGGMNSACRPLFEHGLVYVIAGYKHNLMAIRPSGTGDVSDTHTVWSSKKSVPDMTSQLIIGDHFFMVNGGGSAACLEAKTGNLIWRQRLGGHYYWASPLYADGKIYFFSKEGNVSVIAASEEYKVLAENKFDEGFLASPAVVGNSLILRTLGHLYRIEE